jgi:DNA-binding transcriptional regulator YdaS (Cro superfamily)
MLVNQSQLAELLGVNQTTVSRWTSEEHLPTAGGEVVYLAGSARGHQYDLAIAIRWWHQREISKLGIKKPQDAYFEEKARRERLLRLKDEGRLVEPATIEPALQQYVEDVLAILSGLQHHWDLKLASTQNETERGTIWRAIVREIRTALGSYEFKSETQKETENEQVDPTNFV